MCGVCVAERLSAGENKNPTWRFAVRCRWIKRERDVDISNGTMNRRKSGTCKFLGGCNKAISPVILAIITSPSMLRKVIGAGVVGGC